MSALVAVSLVLVGAGNASAVTRTATVDSSTASYVASKFRADRKISPVEARESCLTAAAKSWAKASVKKDKWTATPLSSVTRSCDVGGIQYVRYSGKARMTNVVKSLRKAGVYKAVLKSKTTSLYGVGAYYDKKSKAKKVVLLVGKPSGEAAPTRTPTPTTPVPIPSTPAPDPTPSTPDPTPSNPAPDPTPSPTTPVPVPDPVYTAPVREAGIEDGIKTELVRQMGAPRNEGDTYEFTGGNQCLDDVATNWGLATGSDKNKDKTFVVNSFFNNTACQYEFSQGMVIRSDKSDARDIVTDWLTDGTYDGTGTPTGGGLGARGAFKAYLLNGAGDLAVSTYTDFRGKTWTYLIAGFNYATSPARLTPHQITVLNDEMQRLLNEYRVANSQSALVRTTCLDDFAEGARAKAGSHILSAGSWEVPSMSHRNIMAPCTFGNSGEVITNMSLYDYQPTDEYALGLAARAMNNFKNSAAHNRAILRTEATDNGVAAFHSDFGGSIFVVLEPASD